MKNWKTTLTGILTGGGYIFLSHIQNGLKPRDAAIGAGIVILGMLSKDRNVTGGSVNQGSTQEVTNEKREELAVPSFIPHKY